MYIWELLNIIKNNGPEIETRGICCNLKLLHLQCKAPKNSIEFWETNSRECFRGWGKFSGVLNYPIPHPTLRPDHAYHAHHAYFYNYGGMWDPNVPYGADRLELLDRCIKWFKEIEGDNV